MLPDVILLRASLAVFIKLEVVAIAPVGTVKEIDAICVGGSFVPHPNPCPDVLRGDFLRVSGGCIFANFVRALGEASTGKKLICFDNIALAERVEELLNFGLKVRSMQVVKVATSDKLRYVDRVIIQGRKVDLSWIEVSDLEEFGIAELCIRIYFDVVTTLRPEMLARPAVVACLPVSSPSRKAQAKDTRKRCKSSNKHHGIKTQQNSSVMR